MKNFYVVIALATAALSGTAVAKDRKDHHSSSHSSHCKAGDYFWGGRCHSVPQGHGGSNAGNGGHSDSHSGGHSSGGNHCKSGDYFWGDKCHSYPRGGYHHVARPIYHGNAPWSHWNHHYNRPVYSWNWVRLNSVTCMAEDSYGDLFPVTETGYAGSAYQPILYQVQDAAMDFCYDETGGDIGCHLVSCTPYYY